ncbi:DUF6314 family protein [Candidatus Spongiihabitans sp.]|uniref:DUF6314 family protein n=1 Tax=Candidatus Spongiihabitans sp. TaxID=3101308 RepID=UPI003C7AC84E
MERSRPDSGIASRITSGITPGIALWNTLKNISEVHFTAKSSKGEAGWNGRGKGEVVAVPDDKTIIFSETGKCTTRAGAELAFSNRYRWRLNEEQNSIQLEHLRYGADNPVQLIELVATGKRQWNTVTPHICNQDSYTLALTHADKKVRMVWKVVGPRKNECIRYHYR